MQSNQKYSYHKQSKLVKHFQWNNLYLEHIQSSHVSLERGTVFTCQMCTRGFLNQNDLKNHQKKYYKSNQTLKDSNNQFPKPYKCDECGVRFVKESTLLTHSILHQPFPHICECGIGYYKKCDLDAHRRLLHPILKPVKPIVPIIKQEFTGNSKPIYKTDSEAEDSEEPEELDDHNYETNSRVGPRLKAKLSYKQPKKKSKKNPTRIKRNYEGTRGELVIKDESGLYKCPACTKTYTRRIDINGHMNEHTESKFKCDECRQELPSIRKFILHKRQHAGVEGFSCSVCNKNLTSKRNLELHMRIHTGEKPHACHLCPKKFSQSGTLASHLIRHTGVKKYECDECKKRFFSFNVLQLHHRVHSGEKPFKCEICGKCFADPSAHKRHLVIHTGTKPYKCKLCPKAFCDPAALYRHTRLHQSYSVPCTMCEKTFRSRDAMFKHTKIIHETIKEEDKFECDHCSKRFMLRQYLVIHMKAMHLKLTKRVKCEICNKSISKNMYKRHMQSLHLGVFRSECEICGQVCTTSSSLKTHMRIHNGIKDRIYECDYCHKSYPYKVGVAKHIASVHMGIKCKICNKAFLTAQKLRLHRAEGCVTCSVCRMPFHNKSLLKLHFINHLPRDQRQVFECDYCSKQFQVKWALVHHIRNVHRVWKAKFSCDHCKESFYNRNMIREHIWDKHMVSLYCNVCLKRFYNESVFRQHKRAGCRLKQMPCDICELQFTSAYKLKNHLVSHGPKRIECDLCGFKSKHKTTVKRHLKLIHGFKQV